MKKITKRENYETLLALLPEMLNAGMIDSAEDAQLAEFLNKELENLDKRSANAKKYASKKKAEADELMEAVNEVLHTTDAPKTIPEIVAIVNEKYEGIEATPQKLTYRLNKLVEDGVATKETVSIKVEGRPARRVNAYSAVMIEDEEE